MGLSKKKYFYEKGVQGDALKILHDHGMNYARLRL
jgi:arabinogalactan endo-1,4-beta-galactosidase